MFHFFDKRQQGVLSALLPFFSAHNFQLGVRIFPIHYPANCLYFLSLNLLPTSHSLYFQSWYYLQVSLSLPSEVTIAAIIDSQASSFLLSQTHSLFKVFPGMGNESLKLDFKLKWQLSSVKFSCSVVFDSFRPHESQHTRPPCPSSTPKVHSDSLPSSPWCHPAISTSLVPFSSCPLSFQATESFPMSELFAWTGQSSGVSALASFLPKNTQDWSPLEWTGWISLQSKGFSRVFSNTTVQKHQFFGTQLSSQSNSHIHTWQLEKP